MKRFYSEKKIIDEYDNTHVHFIVILYNKKIMTPAKFNVFKNRFLK